MLNKQFKTYILYPVGVCLELYLSHENLESKICQILESQKLCSLIWRYKIKKNKIKLQLSFYSLWYNYKNSKNKKYTVTWAVLNLISWNWYKYIAIVDYFIITTSVTNVTNITNVTNVHINNRVNEKILLLETNHNIGCPVM